MLRCVAGRRALVRSDSTNFGTFCWAAPELLLNDDSCSTKAGSQTLCSIMGSTLCILCRRLLHLVPPAVAVCPLAASTPHSHAICWWAAIQPDLLLHTQADIYSFGVVLWEICTGERPVRGQLRAPT